MCIHTTTGSTALHPLTDISTYRFPDEDLSTFFIVFNTPKCPLTEYVWKHSNSVGTMALGTAICGLQRAFA